MRFDLSDRRISCLAGSYLIETKELTEAFYTRGEEHESFIMFWIFKSCLSKLNKTKVNMAKNKPCVLSILLARSTAKRGSLLYIHIFCLI